MITGSLWLTKLILAHLLTDFILQPSQWVKDRNEKHFASAKLYGHGLITALVAWAILIPLALLNVFVSGAFLL